MGNHIEERIPGVFDFTADQVARLRQALQEDLGGGDWTDDEIRLMAHDTLHIMRTLLQVAVQQRLRGLSNMT
jgi:hypothetical protein